MDSKFTCAEEHQSTENKRMQVATYPVVMSKRRIRKNLLMVSLGFMFLCSAYFSLSNLQSTMNDLGSAGVMSLSAMQAAIIISSFFLPEFVIKKFGCKLALVFSILTHLPYVVTNMYPHIWTLLPTAFLLGAGSGILWSSASTYINQLSFMDAKEDVDKAALSTSRFFGIFQMSVKTTQIWGNLVSFYVLRPFDNKTSSQSNVSFVNSSFALVENVSCGVSFCGGGTEETLQPISDEKRYTLVGIYSCLCVLSAIIVALFLDSLKGKEKTEVEEDWKKALLKLMATLKQMVKVDQLLLSILTIFSGLCQGFVVGDYSQAYVACALGLEYVALVFVAFGIVSSITAFLSGYIFKYVPRVVMMTMAAFSHMGLFLALFLWKPDDHYISYFIIVGFWAFSDSIWTIQLAAYHGILFRSNEEAAFANYALFEAIGYFLAFICSSLLCISTKLYMLITFLVFGMAGYLAVEFQLFKYKQIKVYTVSM